MNLGNEECSTPERAQSSAAENAGQESQSGQVERSGTPCQENRAMEAQEVGQNHENEDLSHLERGLSANQAHATANIQPALSANQAHATANIQPSLSANQDHATANIQPGRHHQDVAEIREDAAVLAAESIHLKSHADVTMRIQKEPLQDDQLPISENAGIHLQSNNLRGAGLLRQEDSALGSHENLGRTAKRTPSKSTDEWHRVEQHPLATKRARLDVEGRWVGTGDNCPAGIRVSAGEPLWQNHEQASGKRREPRQKPTSKAERAKHCFRQFYEKVREVKNDLETLKKVALRLKSLLDTLQKGQADAELVLMYKKEIIELESKTDMLETKVARIEMHAAYIKSKYGP